MQAEAPAKIMVGYNNFTNIGAILEYDYTKNTDAATLRFTLETQGWSTTTDVDVSGITKGTTARVTAKLPPAQTADHTIDLTQYTADTLQPDGQTYTLPCCRVAIFINHSNTSFIHLTLRRCADKIEIATISLAPYGDTSGNYKIALYPLNEGYCIDTDDTTNTGARATTQDPLANTTLYDATLTIQEIASDGTTIIDQAQLATLAASIQLTGLPTTASQLTNPTTLAILPLS